ncbi:Fungal-trans domain-containing protein [Fusarium keratoplasticum]|nr:Fungal-trans domain-containing protein [Fusarium keratoplasticum]
MCLLCLAESLSGASCAQPPRVLPGEACIDRILQSGPQDLLLCHEPFVVKVSNVPSSGFAFFSEQRVNSLTDRLKTPRLRELIETLDDLIVERLSVKNNSRWSPIHFRKPTHTAPLSSEEVHLFVQAYFTRVHPLHPFLDRQQFQDQVLSPGLDQLLIDSPAFSALYHAVMALGSQYCQEGSFEPGVGKAWELFQMSLGHMADLIAPRESFESLQALTAMSIFANNVCCIQLEARLVSQAARIAEGLRYHKSSHAQPVHLKTFWVIYAIEKQISFQNRINSIISDDDIGCMVPATPESHFGEFNWFLSTIRFGRLLTIAYQSLFSLSASLRSAESYLAAIHHVRNLLEQWRLSIPAEYQPGGSTHFGNVFDPNETLVALQTHFSYYHLLIGLERLTLHLDKEEGPRKQESRLRLMNTAKAIVELTRFIDLEPHVPLFIICLVPVSALFILFDFVIHNPNHGETRANLSLLDSIAGYFSLVECASKGGLPAGILSGFSSIAREYFCRANEGRPADPRKQREPANSGGSASIPDQHDTEGFDIASEADAIFVVREPIIQRIRLNWSL